MLKSIRVAALAGATVLMTMGFSAPAFAESLKVVASFSIIGDFARNVGGERIELVTLVGPDGDAHVYEPRPADAVAMAAADVILVNGLQFEGFLGRLVEASGATAPVVELTRGSEMLKNADEADDHSHEAAEAGHEHGHAHDHKHDHKHEAGHDHDHGHEGHAGHDHGEIDPHAWQSVHNAETYVKNIAEAFCAADAAGCDTYKANAEAYVEQLEALEEEIKAAVASIPEDKRVIITSHDAFRYFEHEYGIRFLAPEGVSTESEASAADVAALIRQIREDKASAIFMENISDARLIEQIASETGLKVGGALYSDALSGEDGPAATYIDMMRHNVSTITAAIVGS